MQSRGDLGWEYIPSGKRVSARLQTFKAANFYTAFGRKQRNIPLAFSLIVYMYKY